MISAPVFWGVVCGAIYFLIMWWIRTRRLEEQRESTRLLYALSEEIVAAHTPGGIVERLRETLPRLLRASSVEIDLDLDCSAQDQSDSVLFLPLTSHEQPLGAIKVYRADGAFSEDEQAAAEHIANIVSAAIQLQKHQRVREKLFKSEAVEDESASSSSAGDRTLTLMLIDPDPDSRREVVKMLSARGHRVVPCSAEESAEMARRLKFDAVFRVGDEARETNSSTNKISLTRPVNEASLDNLIAEIERSQR